MKGGILFADAVTTVSQRYARDIQSPEFGAGLDAVLREQAGKPTGILNGADYATWNPATDKLIPRKYKADSLAGKTRCRNTLLNEKALAQNRPRPVSAR